ncbi:fimbrial protein [Klebsiella aerogenes]|uniref:fimbrial protein n=1 Tax=Klebsiella aerogenes TaxID=548 RepID=UPI00244A0A97|nr:hypothetical protein [Klebsiella aerogenes]MDH1612392.1 hypothetical protein [Klebsiella aerogenes]
MDLKNTLFRWSRGLLFLVLLLSGISSAQAVNCKVGEGESAPKSFTVPLAGHFYAGNDLPVGSVIYETLVTMSGRVGVYCDAAFNVDGEFRVTNEPAGAPFTQAGTSFTGQIYPTNVPGVGVALIDRNAGLAFTKSAPEALPGYWVLNEAGPKDMVGSHFALALIKTGNITSGGTVYGSSLPSMALNAVAKPGYSGLPINNIWTVNFTGNLFLDTSTCTTPGNPTYDLGKFSPEDFPYVGSKSQNFDVPIHLTNCPVFTGYYSEGGRQQSTDSASPSGGTLKNNMLEMTVTPSAGYYSDGTQMKLNNVSGSASGLAFLLYHHLEGETTLSRISSGQVMYQTMSLERSGDVYIPFVVQLRRIGDLRPGKINGSFTVTINYK